MQKEKILSELYHGNIRPAEKEIVPNSEYRKAQLALFDLVEELDKRLNDEEKKMLDDIMSAWGNLNALNSEEYFTDGFRTGAKIILEIFDSDDEQLKPISG